MERCTGVCTKEKLQRLTVRAAEVSRPARAKRHIQLTRALGSPAESTAAVWTQGAARRCKRLWELQRTAGQRTRLMRIIGVQREEWYSPCRTVSCSAKRARGGLGWSREAAGPPGEQRGSGPALRSLPRLPLFREGA
mmetsp:Transcript_20304/g.61843  ORF Transcript_20304/g.61843 Transcript_20304/m.61843 type:complete len:137 (-) Transcript_20304:39-449(-)|eukprot:scaffold77017_cov37-Tisochrysis_lutea.AAC.2